MATTRRALTGGVVAALAVPLAAGLLTAPAQAATEYYAVPAGGVYTVSGHGWGHGHGMSQWGAEGAAESGLTAAQIMAESYPGTASGSVAGATIRVHLTAAGSTALTVWATAGLALAGTALPAGPQQFRLSRSGSGLVLQTYDGATWTPTSTTFPSSATFSDPASVVRVGTGGASTDYRGTVGAVVAGSGIAVVDTLPLDAYVQGVVPRESPSSWRPAALQAQAIAARTYAVNEAINSGGASYDICDTDACQVYGGKHSYPASGAGYELETASTNAAVAATAGQIRTWQGKAAFTQFSSSDGGYTSDGGYPYLNAHPDPYDGVDPANTGNTWSATLSASQVQKAFPAVGTLTAIEVTGREGSGDWGGRVTHVVLHGVGADGRATTVTTTGYGVMNANPWPGSSSGLRSQWWTLGAVAASPAPGPVAPPAAPVVTPATPAGLVALAPSTVTLPRQVRAGHPVTVSLKKLLPAGASAVVLSGQTGAVTAATPARVTVAPAGLTGRAVPLLTGRRGKTTFGTSLVRVGANGTVVVSVGSGSAAVRLQVLAAVAPGGVVPPATTTAGVLGFTSATLGARFRAAVPVLLRVGATPVTTPAAGQGLRVALPVAVTVAAGRSARTAALALRPPAGATRLLVSVVATGPHGGRVQVWSGSRPAAATLPLGTTGTTSTLVTLPSTSGRVGLQSTGATAVTVTVIGWL